MKLDKAIEILTRISYGDTLIIKFDIESAIKLGGEALKREQNERLAFPYRKVFWLPGETENNGEDE